LQVYFLYFIFFEHENIEGFMSPEHFIATCNTTQISYQQENTFGQGLDPFSNVLQFLPCSFWFSYVPLI